MARRDRQHRLESRQRLFTLTQVEQNRAAIDPRIDVTGVDPQQPVVAGQGILMTPQHPRQVAVVHMSRHIAGISFSGARHQFHSLGHILALGLQYTQ